MARRVLALHGYSQSSSVFYKKTGALRRKLRKKGIDIVYTQAPFELDASQLHGTPPEGESLYGWWTFDETNYYGVEESIEFVSKVIETEGPFEGIIGFSQGACLLSLICAKHSVLSLAGFDSLKYVVLVSAFIPKCSNIQNSCTYFKKEELHMNIPSLHIYGAEDKLITKEKSEDVMSMFVNPENFVHPGAHFVPANGEAMRIVSSFIDKSTGAENISNEDTE